MASEGPLPRAFWAALAAGLALRLWYLADLAGQPWYGFPVVDALTYDRMAAEIAAGGHPGAYFRPPLYPHLLAAVYRVLGRAPLAPTLLQMLAGLAALYPAYRLAERWFGRGAAVAAVWITACYPLRIFFEGELLDVTVAGFLLLWGLWIAHTASERGARARGLLAGCLLGAGCLARPNLMAVLPFVAAAAALAADRRRGLRAAAWGALGVALAILPVAWHNWRAERAFIPIAANGGINFYLGNAPGASGLTPVPPGLAWQGLLLQPVRRGVAGLAETDAYWYREARAAIAADPAGWLALLGRKTLLFFGAAEASNNKALARFTAVSFPVRHYRWWYGALVGLALVGVCFRPGRGAMALGLVVAGFALSVVLFFVTARYRLPLVPLLAGAAAAGGAEIAGRIRSRDARGAALRGALLAAAAIAVFPDWLGAGRERIDADFQLGQVHLMRGEPSAALELLLRARERGDDPDVLNSIAAAHHRLGDLEAAERAYRAILAGGGEYPEVLVNLGIVLEARGPAFLEEAAGAYRRALELNPHESRALANLRALEPPAAREP